MTGIETTRTGITISRAGRRGAGADLAGGRADFAALEHYAYLESMPVFLVFPRDGGRRNGIWDTSLKIPSI